MAASLIRGLALAGLCLTSLPAFGQQAEKPFRLQTALDLPDWLKVGDVHLSGVNWGGRSV
jgi:hypothetical protein